MPEHPLSLREFIVDCVGVETAVPVSAQGISIGREPFDVEGRASLHINASADDTVSRRHAEIIVTADWASVTDLGSTNGSRLNGVPILPHVAMALSDGDEVRCGVGTRIICRA